MIVRAPDYVSLEQRIDNLIELLRTTNEETRSHLLRFAAVLSAGLIEVASQEILAAYSSDRSDPTVAAFVGNQVVRFQNLNAERLCQLVGAFGLDLRRELEAEIAGQITDSINSLVAIRNNVAHGRNSGIGAAALRQYFGDVRKVIRLLEARFPRK